MWKNKIYELHLGYPATIEYDLDIQDARPRLPGQSSCLPFKQIRQEHDILYRFYVGFKSCWFLSGYFGSVSLRQRDRTWSSTLTLSCSTSGAGSRIQSTSMPLISMFWVSFRYVHSPNKKGLRNLVVTTYVTLIVASNTCHDGFHIIFLPYN